MSGIGYKERAANANPLFSTVLVRSMKTVTLSNGIMY